MTKTKVSKKTARRLLEKTDWNKLYHQSQSEIDKEAGSNLSNPVLKNTNFKRIKDRK